MQRFWNATQFHCICASTEVRAQLTEDAEPEVRNHQQAAASKIDLLDLPSELLRAVLDHVCNFDDLLSASLVSKTLRDLVLPILFGSINLAFTSNIRRNGETILDFLLRKQHLQKCIRRVVIRPSSFDFEIDRLEFLKFERLSLGLENLRLLR